MLSALLITGAFAGCQKNKEGSLLICAAASMTDVMKEIVTLYTEENSGVTIDVTYGSSGALSAQIEAGVSADLFLSAAAKQMDDLQEKGYIAEDTRVDLLQNEIVLAVPSDSQLIFDDFNDAVQAGVSRIGIGDPDSVPAGQYAMEIFQSLQIWDKVTAKAVYGSDARAVLTWLENGEIDCGVVYKTDAAISGDKVKVVCFAPDRSCEPVVYPAAVLESSEHTALAKDFLSFLQGEKAAEVFTRYGFIPLAG